MFGIHNYAAFITAILFFQLAPGPGTLAGDLVYMTAAVSGLAALLTANPALLSVVQWGGIAYLCRFGWTLLRASTGNAAAMSAYAGSGWPAFRQAFAVGLTNPKAIIFFLSFFPLFMTAGSRPATLGIMMAHVTLICLLYQTCLVLVGDRIARRLCGMRRVRLFIRRLAGTALIGFGVKLAFDNK